MELAIFIAVVIAVAFYVLNTATVNISTQITGAANAGSSRDVEYETSTRTYATTPAAIESTLTTRTNTTAGVLTVTEHDLTTGDKADIYWDGGKRYNVTIGATTGTTLAISGGTGDNLPAADSVINVGVIEEASFNFLGDDANWLCLQVGVAGYIKLVEHDGTARTYHLIRYVEPGVSYIWDEDSGLTNPLAGLTITHAHFSQSDTTADTNENVATVGITA